MTKTKTKTLTLILTLTLTLALTLTLTLTKTKTLTLTLTLTPPNRRPCRRTCGRATQRQAATLSTWRQHAQPAPSAPPQEQTLLLACVGSEFRLFEPRHKRQTGQDSPIGCTW